MAGRPCVSVLAKPFTGDDLEAAGRVFLLGSLDCLPVLARIDALRQELARLIPAFSGILQTDFWIDAHGNRLAFSVEAVI